MSVAVIGCHSLWIYTAILLLLLSFSVKMTVSPRASVLVRVILPRPFVLQAVHNHVHATVCSRLRPSRTNEDVSPPDQGESNNGQDELYSCRYKMMMDEWRADWHVGTGGGTHVTMACATL
jgi:hypothetical protein